MFIYEKNGSMCVTFKGNKPVDTPEYVITIDPITESISINGKKFIDPLEETPVLVEETPAPVEEKLTKKASKKEVVPPVEQSVEEATQEVITE